MNNSSVNKQVYAQKVELLLRLMPVVMEECVFAVHGGTAINLFLKDLPRYSVDIDRPIHESLAPRLIDQREAMVNQFDGMTDILFTYDEFEETRAKLVAEVNSILTDEDKRFLLSFEKGTPEWGGYEYEYLKDYPSVQWKLVNLAKLANQNPDKLKDEARKLETLFGYLENTSL